MTQFEVVGCGFVGLRWYSIMNPWLDFVVFVREEESTKATNIITKAMDDYWESDNEAYGDLVEFRLKKANIPFWILYYPADDDAGDMWAEEFEEALEMYQRTIPIRTIS